MSRDDAIGIAKAMRTAAPPDDAGHESWEQWYRTVEAVGVEVWYRVGGKGNPKLLQREFFVAAGYNYSGY